MTAGEAVLELTQLWETEAEVLRNRHADESETCSGLTGLATRIRRSLNHDFL